ncbi:AP-3 complex subunit beta-1-like isoform X4 [Convolutriloba macropyga]|uniref:AP-3 complex subunit beta-1-like isoform X4 n=1 Tax=Convolutriloba macropyga TaxID=536237 RepID=UPI003F527D92
MNAIGDVSTYRSGNFLSNNTSATLELPNGTYVYDNDPHEDLKELLESNKDPSKLEAMKTIIGMIAKGKDAGELFPQVVKNVVSKNVEVKKLVYVYLERYAEEQQDLALLSVATFQKALKDPNQLIRASALRVLSSIRVSVITPIMLLAIKDACADMSPFVRKSAANAIPKLYSLDPDTKEELIGAIEKLLADKTTLVAGSAIYAFEELCPDRLDLVHKHYRRLCSLLVDVDEWGQVVVANMLIRYAKTQFLDPNEGDVSMDDITPKKTTDDPSKFFADSSDEESDDEKQSVASSEKAAKNVMDPDHRLLLRNSKPLLQSRNSAVVMTVCQMYYYLAPRSEINCIVKPMIRLLKSHREIQAIVLNWLVTFSRNHKVLVEPYLKSFYIRASDPTHVKLLKLEILTNLASETSIGFILKEFQAYVHNSDPKFVAATIYAIGRCATTIAEVSDQCLHGLMGLMASKNEVVVAESVVVTKKLLQQKPDENLAVIVHMAKMIDKITIPMARASILWMLGENCDKVQKYAPDVLRKFAKSFPNEAYVHNSDPKFVAATIYAIGRCATTIAEVSDQCLHGLMGLMASKNEVVVAESVVVTKKLLQQKPDENLAVIVHMAKMIDKITIPMARASILWMLGENCDKVQKYAPDVLRKFAKSFPNEEDIVKLQVVNLAAKLYVTNSKQVKLLVQYVLNLAKYDENYDIRDRARLIRGLIIPTNGKNNINKHAKKILFCDKPAPVLSSTFQSRNEFRMNTLSHYLNQRCSGYEELPEWPMEKPDPSVRDVEPPPEPPKPSASSSFYERDTTDTKDKTKKGEKGKKKQRGFYSDEDESEEEEEKDSDDEESGNEEENSDEEAESEDQESEEESSEEESGSESDDGASSSKKKSKRVSKGGKKTSETSRAKKKGSQNLKESASGKKVSRKGDADDNDEDDDDESREESSDDEKSEESENESDSDESDKDNKQSVTTKQLRKTKDDSEEESSEEESSEDEKDSKPVKGSQLTVKGRQNSSSSKHSSNQSSPGKGKQKKTQAKVEESESEEDSSESEEEEKKPTGRKQQSSKQEETKNAKGKNKPKKDLVDASEEVSTIVEEATLLNFDDDPSTTLTSDLSQPSNTAVTQGASSNQQQPMRNKPMLPTLVSQNSEDRGFANVPGTPTSLPGGPEGLELLPSSPSALHASQKGEVELLNRLLGRGLAVKARFTRKPFIYDENKVSIELLFANTATDATQFSNISIVDKKLPTGMSLDEFPKIGVLSTGQVQNAYIGIDFCDSLQPAHFTIGCTLNESEVKQFSVQISCTVGDLLRPCTCTQQTFATIQGRLTGMNENECKVESLTEDLEESEILRRVFTICNVGQVPSQSDNYSNIYMFCGVTASSATPVLISINLRKKKLTVNCEKMVIGSKLMKELKESLLQ